MKPYVLGLCDLLAVRGVGDDVVDLVHAVFFYHPVVFDDSG